MKQRITYLLSDPDTFSPELLDVKQTSLSLSKLKAAKEHKLTFGLSELPAELRKTFEQWHELHIRWASGSPYKAVPPFTSRVTPGLHVFYTAQKNQPEANPCPILKDAFSQDIKCSGPTTSFTKMPILAERFSMSSALQYFSYLPDISRFASFVGEKICPSSSSSCKEVANAIRSADYVDLDYDVISHAINLNVLWNQSPSSNGWDESHSLESQGDRIEIGVLKHDPNPDPEDIAFSGFLTVLGQDTQPKPTQFQTPTRHYPLLASAPHTYKAHFPPPTGLHPTLQLQLPISALTPPDPTCKLHTHLTLPSYLFLDKYSFSDPLSLSAQHLTALHSISGSTDLEAPDWVIDGWGSAALFEIALPESAEDGKGSADWQVEIPLHLRYLPATHASHTRVTVPWPVVFWACRSDEGAAKQAVNPFDRTHLGYEGLFGPKTRFMHLEPEGSGNASAGAVEWLDVPVLDLRSAGWVEGGTVGVVGVAFLGLCWVLWRVWAKGDGAEAEGREKKRQ